MGTIDKTQLSFLAPVAPQVPPEICGDFDFIVSMATTYCLFSHVLLRAWFDVFWSNVHIKFVFYNLCLNVLVSSMQSIVLFISETQVFSLCG